MIKRIIWLILILLTAAAASVVYWLQDANQFKPDIEALIAEHSDVKIQINGDLSWQLWPPLTLQVENITAVQSGTDIAAARLDLKVDLSAMWQDVNAWKVTSLNLRDVTVTDGSATTKVDYFILTNFKPGEPAQFTLDLEHTIATSETPTTAALAGELTFFPGSQQSPQRLSFVDTAITSNHAEGVCQADLTERMNAPTEFPPETPEDLLPIATLASYNATIECQLDALHVTTETFTNTALNLTNVDGQTSTHAEVPDFFGGSLIVDADIDTTSLPAQWTILPEMQNVDSQQLIDWTDQTLTWAAPLALTSTITMQGNTEVELIESVRAQAEFDGGQGLIDLSKIKQQLSRLALLTQRSDQVANWPDVLNYESMTGRLNIEGDQHRLSFDVDNLSVTANGPIDYLADSVDLLAYVTVSEPIADSPITINEWFIDTPIPMRCRGTSSDPECRLDNDAAKSIVASALRRGNESGLRRKLEDKIEEDVPDEYKETARSLLDLLGRSLEPD